MEKELLENGYTEEDMDIFEGSADADISESDIGVVIVLIWWW